jgi:drug/metabolite transporter (DMT)-like permease
MMTCAQVWRMTQLTNSKARNSDMKTLGAGASKQSFAGHDGSALHKLRPRISVRYWLAIVMLICAALLWGFGNVAQKLVLHDISSPTLLFIRSIIALISLLPLAILECRQKNIGWRDLKKHGVPIAITALSFALGLACQTIGAQFTTATNIGFIINLCVLFTPLMLYVVFGESISKLTLLSCAICFLGAVMLTGLHMQKPNFGDALCFVGAIFYAIWIIAIDRSLKLIDAPILTTAVQFIPTSLFGLALPPGELQHLQVASLWPALLFVSILSTCVGFLIAAFAQRLVQPVVAGLIYSFEALFGALGAWAVLGERLTPTAMTGGALMFVSILVCQYCVCSQVKMPVVSRISSPIPLDFSTQL